MRANIARTYSPRAAPVRRAPVAPSMLCWAILPSLDLCLAMVVSLQDTGFRITVLQGQWAILPRRGGFALPVRATELTPARPGPRTHPRSPGLPPAATP